MQTPGEKQLIFSIISELKKFKFTPRIINIGAWKSLVIEKELDENNCRYIEDRIDILDCHVNHKSVDKAWVSSVEEMSVATSEKYDLAFANYVLEHVPNLKKASSEIYRILKKNSKFITTLPNTEAPEFKISKYTPLWFHQIIRGKGEGHEAHETFYSYKNIAEFVAVFESTGFTLEKTYYFPNTYGYLYRFPIINLISKFYDWIIKSIGANKLMGNVCIVFEKKI